MSKYIGTPVVNISADTVDVTGDITTTDSTPEVIIVNNTHEDTDGGREGKVTFKGQQSGGEETTLAQIQASHDGTSDDEKGDLIFKTNDGSDGASPTEAMRIDSSQNVGIGVAAPESGFHLSDGTNVGSPQNSSRKATLTIEAGSEGSADIQLLNASYNHIFFGDAADANIGYQVYDHTNNSLQFGVNAAERMRITSDGFLCVGTTTSASNGMVSVQFARGTTAGFRVQDSVGSGGTGVIADFYNSGGTSIGSITHDSSSITYNTTSDIRAKENIENVVGATDKVMSMRPVTYTWKSVPENGQETGFIAQEMQKIVPEAVTGDPSSDEMMSMDYGRITPVLVGALQDAHKKIETLEKRLSELEAK